MNVNEIKEYLRVDGEEETSLITNLQTAAENYLTNAGCTKDYSNELYKLAIKLLVSHWYENRQIEQVGTNITKLEYSLDPIIAQLKYCRPEAVE